MKHEFGIEMHWAGVWHLTHSPGLGYQTRSEAEKRADDFVKGDGLRYRVVEYDYEDAARYNIRLPRPSDEEIRELIDEVSKIAEEYAEQGKFLLSYANETLRDTLRWVLGEMRKVNGGFEEVTK